MEQLLTGEWACLFLLPGAIMNNSSGRDFEKNQSRHSDIWSPLMYLNEVVLFPLPLSHDWSAWCDTAWSWWSILIWCAGVLQCAPVWRVVATDAQWHLSWPDAAELWTHSTTPLSTAWRHQPARRSDSLFFTILRISVTKNQSWHYFITLVEELCFNWVWSGMLYNPWSISMCGLWAWHTHTALLCSGSMTPSLSLIWAPLLGDVCCGPGLTSVEMWAARSEHHICDEIVTRVTSVTSPQHTVTMYVWQCGCHCIKWRC